MMTMAELWPAMAALGGLVTLILLVAGKIGAGIKGQIKVEADQRANSAANILKADLKNVTDKHDHRIDKLEEKSADYRSGKTIDDNILHLKNNLVMMINGAITANDRTANTVDALRERTTRIEVQNETTNKIVGEIKSELKDTRQDFNLRLDKLAKETGDRFDIAAKTQQQQFEQLCNSIREQRVVSPK